MLRRRTHCALTLALTLLAGLAGAPAASGDGARPNILLIFTDDQPKSTMTRESMPNTLAWLDDGGVEFKNAYASYPLCCPSRATMLTGRYAQNHGVLSNEGSFGGLTAFNSSPLPDGDFEPAFSVQEELQAAGYLTGYVGKYLNGYGEGLPQGSTPRKEPHWDEWHTLIGQSNDMWGFKLLEAPLGSATGTKRSYGYANPSPPTKVNNAANYQTNVLRDRAIDALNRFETTADARPFFLVFAPHAPHSEGNTAETWVRSATDADRARFADEPLAGDRAFDEALATLNSKPPHIRAQPALATTPTSSTTDDPARTLADQVLDRRRDRMGSMLAVDRAIGALRTALGDEAENTVVVFTTDNGMFEGEHRIPEGKIDVYDGAAKIPLLLKSPGGRVGANVQVPVSNADIGATILDAAGVDRTTVEGVDGRPLTDIAAMTGGTGTRPILLQSGTRLPDGSIRGADRANRPDYVAIRTTRYLYVEYEPASTDIDRGEGAPGPDPFAELYDLTADPWQLQNKAYNKRFRTTRQVLHDKLVALEQCAGPECRLGTGAIPPPS